MIIKERIKQISSRITEVCNRIGTDPATIKLLAVTKNHPVQAIEEVLEAGLLTIAENKVQESLQKIPGLKGKFEEFHFIGHLQSNKLRKVLGLKPFLIHSIDSVSTLSKMERILAETNQNQQILIQVNTSQETSKSGIEPSQLESFIKDCAAFSHITICGLMTIGKLTNDESEIRECFKLLNKKYQEIKQINQNNLDIKYLSMGMSSDFEIAIEEGANIVRIGSAIMGPRNY